MLDLNDLKLLQFKASWCGPCKAQSKEFEDNNLDIELKPIDIEEEEELCDKYSIKSIPTMILLDNEENELNRWSGFTKTIDINNYIKGIKNE